LNNARIVPADTVICNGASVQLKVNVNGINTWGSLLQGTIQNGLLAYFPFQSTVKDESGRNNTVQVQNVGLDTDRFGNANAAGKFGIPEQSFIFLPATPQLQPNSYTLSTWFKTNEIRKGSLGSNDDQAIALFTPDNWLKGPVFKHGLVTTDNSILQSRQWTLATSWQDIDTPSDYVKPGQWYHAVTTYDALTKVHKLYINGQLYASRTSEFGYEGQIGLLIGASREQSSGEITQHFNGSLDDIALWNRPLSDIEVTGLYGGNTISTVWSTGESGSSIIVKPTATQKFYATTSVASFSCIDSVLITVQQLNADAILINDTTVCSPGNVLLSAQVPEGKSTDWYTKSEDGAYVSLLDNSLQYNLNFKGIELNLYLKLRSVANGCVSDNFKTIKVMSDTSSGPVFFSPDYICAGDSIQLQLPMKAVYRLYRNDLEINEQNTQAFTLNLPGIYSVSVLNQYGCVKFSTAKTIVEKALPVARIDTGQSAAVICGTTPLVLKGNLGLFFSWFRDKVLIDGANERLLSVNETGKYQLRVKDDFGCSSMLSSPIEVRKQNPLGLSVSYDTTCVSIPFKMAAKISGNALSSVFYEWNISGAVFKGDNLSVQFAIPGTFKIKLKVNTAFCPSNTDSLETNVTIRSSEPGIRMSPVNGTINQSIQLSARDNGLAYQWLPALGLDNPSIKNPKTKLSNEQAYIIRVVTAGKCLTYDTLLVRAFKQKDILVPKAFTPNADGKNDYLFPVLVGLEKLVRFAIFDRWGKLIFSMRDIGNKGWDGGISGLPLSPGIYIWMAEAIDTDGTVFRRNGNTMLIR
jgi:gliding motility-associated-like protein